MPEITEAQLKAGLSAIKFRYSNLHRADQRNPIRTTQRETLGKLARHGIDGRRKALEQLATIARAPNFIMLNKPFLIWANRFFPPSTDPNATDILRDTHIEPLNSWAKIILNYASDDFFSATQFATDQLNFYFFWRNESGFDAIVNVTSYLTLNGSCMVHANAGGLGLYHPNGVTVYAGLSVFEWWNEPPTEPLSEPNQSQKVTHVGAGPNVFSGDTREALIPPTDYQVTYNIFRAPSNDLAVFEVGLSLDWFVNNGSVNVDFSFEDQLVMCPFLQLEVFTVGPWRPPLPPRRPIGQQ